MRLFIAEKPSMGKAIAARLKPVKSHSTHIECANDVVVSWCFGHLFETAPPEHYSDEFKKWSLQTLPIVPTAWKLLPKKEAKAQIKVLKELLAKCDSVVNAGDPDDEGTLLVYEVLEELKFKGKVLRIWLASLDDASIDKALAQLKDGKESYGMKEAAQARSRADWLIGMNLTRAYTLIGQAGGAQGVLSVGRVQTPTLGLVVKRDLEIEAFKPRDFFEVYGTFSSVPAVVAKWQISAQTKGLDEEGRLLDKAVAQGVATSVQGKTGTVKSFESKALKSAPPLPFSLSALQGAASAAFGLSAKKVLDICQSLYETHKLTTYPRTDCQYLPLSMHAEVREVLASMKKSNPSMATLIDKADPSIQGAVFNDKKITAHHAIIPTKVGASVRSLSSDEAKVYQLICKHYLALFYPDHEYLQNTVEIAVGDYVFKASGKQVTQAGWKSLFQDTPDQDEEPEMAVPVLKKDQQLRCEKAEVRSKKTTAPARFTEGTLIKAMANIGAYVQDDKIKKLLKESAGIGTEATRAAVLETLKDRGYLQTKGKQLVSTDKARALIKALPDVLSTPDLTAMFEQRLGEIRDGQLSGDEFIDKQVVFIKRLLELSANAKIVVEAAHKCPKCSQGLRRINGKNGYFWGCSGFREGCKFVTGDKKGKPETA